MWVEGGLKEQSEEFFSDSQYVLKAYSVKQRGNTVNNMHYLK